MLLATLLALAAAVLHAGWNLMVKHGGDDRFLLLWGQFFLAGLISIPAALLGGLPAEAWKWIALSGVVHIPYAVFLARAYDRGDFSVVYPIARGGGASLAAIGGVLFLSDNLSALSAAGIAVAALGIVVLPGPFGQIDKAAAGAALAVAASIAGYSLFDASGARISNAVAYGMATHLGSGGALTAYGIATGRESEMRRVLGQHWRRLLAAAIASTVTYTLVQVAFTHAPVGYVTALRESSVVLAAIVGWRHLDEPVGRRRTAATVLVVLGLITLVAGR